MKSFAERSADSIVFLICNARLTLTEHKNNEPWREMGIIYLKEENSNIDDVRGNTNVWGFELLKLQVLSDS